MRPSFGQGSPCGDCKWKGKVNLCPYYVVECDYACNKDKDKDSKDKSVVKKSIDRELE